MPVFSTPLSGLTANSTALSAIANNLANLNTVGYKETRAVFRDLFYQTLGASGSGSPIQLGTGAAVAGLTTVLSGGSVESSGISTDVAIVGDGFFVLQNADNLQFSRAGNFHVGPDGHLLSEDGQYVMGYPAENGVIPDGQSMGPLQVGKGQISPPSATTEVELGANLDASAEIGGSFSTSATVYDSLGATHVVTLKFVKSSNNEWDYQVSMPSSELNVTPGKNADGTDAAVPDNVVLKTGKLVFDSTGKLSAVDPSSDPSAPAVTSVSISTSVAASPLDPASPYPTTVGVNGLADGADQLNLSWNLFASEGNGLFTQVSAPSSPTSSHQNGCGAGMLLDFNIGEDGMIQGSFSNGKTMLLGQIALANFANPEGLSRAGQNNFSETLSSGVAVLGAPNAGGRGKLAGGALELSNVDIAQEFSRMIMAQRGFQANARAITTFDEIAQETINLKR
jgi:flagellar hook protein FlgE